MTINYNNKEIELRFTFRADMLFENATGVTFTGKNESEWLQYFFCTLVALTKDESMRFDEFLDWISEPQNLGIFYDFIKWYSEFHTSVMEKRQSQQADADEKKKAAQKPMRDKKK